MKMRITPTNLEMLESFEKYVSKGGSILSFSEYYKASNNLGDFKPEKYVILLALCEELALVGDRKKIFEILNIVFSVERWSLKSFKRFMSSIKNSDLLNPLYDGIFDLHENCKNYMKTM